jgi:hypothetical protein
MPTGVCSQRKHCSGDHGRVSLWPSLARNTMRYSYPVAWYELPLVTSNECTCASSLRLRACQTRMGHLILRHPCVTCIWARSRVGACFGCWSSYRMHYLFSCSVCIPYFDDAAFRVIRRRISASAVAGYPQTKLRCTASEARSRFGTKGGVGLLCLFHTII